MQQLQQLQPDHAPVATSTSSNQPNNPPSNSVFPLLLEKEPVLALLTQLSILLLVIGLPFFINHFLLHSTLALPRQVSIALKDPSWQAAMEKQMATPKKWYLGDDHFTSLKNPNMCLHC